MSRPESRRPRRDDRAGAPDASTPSTGEPPAIDYATPRIDDAAPTRREHPLDTLGTLVCVFVVLLTLGFICFRMFRATFVSAGASATHDRSIFASANAVTGTGFQQGWAAVSEYAGPGHGLLAVLSIGGALLSMVGGGALLSRALKLDLPLRTLVVASLAILGAGAVLTVPLGSAPLLGGSLDSISAVTGSGLSVHAAYTPAQLTLHAVALPLFVIGGLGPVGLIALGRLFAGRPIAPLLVQMLGWIAGTYVVSTLLLWALLADRYAFPQSLAAASAYAVDARGLGLPVGQLADLPVPVVWALLPLMLLGVGPASAAGGLSALPIALLAMTAIALVRGTPAPRFGGVAIVWVALQALLIFVTLVVLLATTPQLQPDRMFFIVVSAACNVGLSHDPLGLTGVGSYAVALAMCLGKLLPLAMLAWMAAIAERGPASN